MPLKTSTGSASRQASPSRGESERQHAEGSTSRQNGGARASNDWASRSRPTSPGRDSFLSDHEQPSQTGAQHRAASQHGERTPAKFKLRIDDSPDGCANGTLVTTAAEDLAQLCERVGERLHLAGVQIQIFDSDFEEWLQPSGLEDIPRVATIRVTAVSGQNAPTGALAADFLEPVETEETRIFDISRQLAQRPGTPRKKIGDRITLVRFISPPRVLSDSASATVR
jgi:hypothetical protein